MAIAKALGIDLVKDRPDSAAPDAIDIDPSAPTLAQLTATVPMPVPGGDTLATSLAILEKLKG